MTVHQIARGDQWEFALVITDPITGLAVDMRDHGDWEVWVAIGGTSILKTFSEGELPVNVDHPDEDAPDGSLQLILTQAETLDTTSGSHRVYVKLRDSEGVEHTTLNGTEYDLHFSTTPLTNQ